jgi:hypothetical protein
LDLPVRMRDIGRCQCRRAVRAIACDAEDSLAHSILCSPSPPPRRAFRHVPRLIPLEHTFSVLNVGSADLSAAARIRDAPIEQFGQHCFGVGLRAIAEAAGVLTLRSQQPLGTIWPQPHNQTASV